jgi:uncharacterized membrane protein YfhO
LGAPGFDSKEVVYLPETSRRLGFSTNRARVSVDVQSITRHRIRTEVDASDPATMVVAQSYYRAWKASVDGRPAPVVPANLAFQAIPIPAGRHQVELAYRDNYFRAGSAISLTTLAGLALAWFGLLKRAWQ